MRERFLETGAKDKSSIYMQTLYPLSACTYRYSGVFGAVADRRSIQGRAGPSSKEGREWCFLSFFAFTFLKRCHPYRRFRESHVAGW